jgi:hypothetical protein
MYPLCGIWESDPGFWILLELSLLETTSVADRRAGAVGLHNLRAYGTVTVIR